MPFLKNEREEKTYVFFVIITYGWLKNDGCGGDDGLKGEGILFFVFFSFCRREIWQ